MLVDVGHDHAVMRPRWVDQLIAKLDVRGDDDESPRDGKYENMRIGLARYPTLDHADPSIGSGGWLVVAAAVNDMKSDLTLAEARRAWALLPWTRRRPSLDR